MEITIIKGKKGGVSTILLDIWAYVAFVLVVLIFYALFSFMSNSAKEHKITELETSSKSYLNLINYLRTPVVVDNKATNMAELIRLWNIQQDKYKDVLEKTSVNILNGMEYDYPNPATGSKAVRGFNIVINEQKKDNKPSGHLIEFKSKSFENGDVIRDEYGRGQILAEQFIPISADNALYIILFESQKAK